MIHDDIRVTYFKIKCEPRTNVSNTAALFCSYSSRAYIYFKSPI